MAVRCARTVKKIVDVTVKVTRRRTKNIATMYAYVNTVCPGSIEHFEHLAYKTPPNRRKANTRSSNKSASTYSCINRYYLK